MVSTRYVGSSGPTSSPGRPRLLSRPSPLVRFEFVVERSVFGSRSFGG